MKKLFTLLLDISFLSLFATENSIEQYGHLDTFGTMPSGMDSSSFLKDYFSK